MTNETSGAGTSVWAWVPAGLLASMLCGLGLLAYIATDDPHFALEPDYYDKAVHWDRSQSEARESDSSGIGAELGELVVGSDGRVQVKLRLLDRDGAPIHGAEVRAFAFANAYAARALRLELREEEPGAYTAWIERPALGLWELRLEADVGARHFRRTLRRDVTKQVKA
jgi:nitrogen fixation protein FixH